MKKQKSNSNESKKLEIEEQEKKEFLQILHAGREQLLKFLNVRSQKRKKRIIIIVSMDKRFYTI